MDNSNRTDERQRAHLVSLSSTAFTLVKAILDSTDNDLLFSGAKKGKPLSNMAMLAVLKRMKRTDLTVHGFRSTFRDWAAECTLYPHEMAEMALAHIVGVKLRPLIVEEICSRSADT